MAAQGLETTLSDFTGFIPEPAQQNPIVFPGVELTLQVLCQAIILLDASAPVALQEALLQSLGLAPLYGDEHEKGPRVVRLPITSLKALDDRLRQNVSLKDRYIILPNLNEGGDDTILRPGFHHHYAEMPCVGGYTEKDYINFGTGHLNKLNGGDHNYGSKAVGLFQTSDSRREDYKHLACRTTWVKFAEPTAEALRQACLSYESRLFQPTIAQPEPLMPRRYISRVEITASVYLGTVDLHLNPQFNALIGGRGTGKSTFLEYVRWAMQDQPIEYDSGDALDRKRHYFVETLREVDGIVRVHWSFDGTSHIVSFDAKLQMMTLKVGNDAERQVTGDEICNLLPIRAYSQKQLSSVSGKRGELQRFVEEPVRARLQQFENEFDSLRSQIRTHYANRNRRRELSAQLHLQQTRLSSTQKRIRTLQDTLSNVTPEAERAMREHSARLIEHAFVETLTERVNRLLGGLENIDISLGPAPGEHRPLDDTPESDLILRIEATLGEKLKALSQRVREAVYTFRGEYREVEVLIMEWQQKDSSHKAVLKAAQTTADENSAVMKQLAELREEEREAAVEIARLQRAIAEIPDGNAALPDEWNQWIGLHTKRSQVLADQGRALASGSNGKLDIELHPGKDIDDALLVLETKLQGARIHPNRWEALKAWLSDGGMAVQRWNRLCLEILDLIESEEHTSEAAIPTIPTWELTDQMRAGIRNVLTPDSWLDIATLTIQDTPAFFYKGGGTRLQFERASAGQQATVLLTLLLKDDGGPLIIDQPEDDLDSEIIAEVIRDIRAAKHRRQIIFASHNANLVVNGDAELVVKFGTKLQDGQTHGEIEHEGAIDCKPVREAITAVMEGGRKAFDLRRQKYGF